MKTEVQFLGEIAEDLQLGLVHKEKILNKVLKRIQEVGAYPHVAPPCNLWDGLTQEIGQASNVSSYKPGNGPWWDGPVGQAKQGANIKLQHPVNPINIDSSPIERGEWEIKEYKDSKGNITYRESTWVPEKDDK